MNSCDRENWFEAWFDSPYYHMLYAHRNTAEADALILNLQKFLQLKPGARILDLACGKGRHSKALAMQGFNVTGVDLSEHSIEEARKMEDDNLEFRVHDMRRPVAVNYYDAVLNLFTSFGYFTSVRDNTRTIDAVHTALHPEGIFLIDYLNATKVQKAVEASPEGTLDKEGVHFHWKKAIEECAVVKEIEVTDQGKSFAFCEHVQLFSLKDFAELLNEKFDIVSVFGDYNLAPFDEANSDRLILSCRKK
jgi:cyclopropane fatty-acyl-phospholipid synthase-like methyltransferase